MVSLSNVTGVTLDVCLDVSDVALELSFGAGVVVKIGLDVPDGAILLLDAFAGAASSLWTELTSNNSICRISLHWFLWYGQCFCWHAVLQYSTQQQGHTNISFGGKNSWHPKQYPILGIGCSFLIVFRNRRASFSDSSSSAICMDRDFRSLSLVKRT